MGPRHYLEGLFLGTPILIPFLFARIGAMRVNYLGFLYEFSFSLALTLQATTHHHHGEPEWRSGRVLDFGRLLVFHAEVVVNFACALYSSLVRLINGA